MLHIPKIDDYLKFFTDEEVKDFATTNLVNILQNKNCILNKTKNKILEKLLNCFISL